MFHVGADRFVIEAGAVMEVLPLVEWKKVSSGEADPPPGVVGMLNYHREALPVVDLSLLLMGRPTPPLMNTRIFIVDMAAFRKIAVVVERVVGTIDLDNGDFVTPDDIVDTATYLGPVYADAKGIIQRIEIQRVLSEQVYDHLYRENGEAA